MTYDGGMSARLSIGLVARRTGATVPTVRYYEEIGLLPAASRTASGQRSYDEATVRRLVFIRRCRDFGFSLGIFGTFLVFGTVSIPAMRRSLIATPAGAA